MELVTNLLVGLVISLLVIALTWIMNEVRVLKAKGEKAAFDIIPDEWEWIAADVARTFVRAAYQLFPPDAADQMLDYVLDNIYAELKKRKVEIGDADKNKIRAIVEAAVVDFYIALGKPELTGS